MKLKKSLRRKPYAWAIVDTDNDNCVEFWKWYDWARDRAKARREFGIPCKVIRLYV